MGHSKNNKILFNPSGCLSLDAINRYHANQLTEKEHHAVTMHLEECEICQDAAEGYKNLPDKNKQQQVLLILRNKIRNRSGTGYIKIAARRSKRINSRVAYMSAAATILIILGVYAIINTDIFYKNDIIAEQIQEKEGEKDLIIEAEEPITEAESTPLTDTEKIEESPELVERGLMEEPTQKETIVTAVDLQSEEEIAEPFPDEEQKEAEQDKSEIPDTFLIDGLAAVGGVADEAAGAKTIPVEAVATPVSSERRSIGKGSKKEKKDQSIRITDIHTAASVKELPQFSKVGFSDFNDFIHKRLEHISDSLNKPISGKLVVEFVVTEKGFIEAVKIINGIDSLLDAETVRIIQSSTNWEPGKYDGKMVPVRLEKTFTFQ